MSPSTVVDQERLMPIMAHAADAESTYVQWPADACHQLLNVMGLIGNSDTVVPLQGGCN